MKEFLSKVPLFAELSDQDFDMLCQGIEIVTLENGKVLFKEGDLGDKAYVIKSGELEIIKEANGREILLNVKGTGTVIGEMALIEDSTRMASVRARGQTELIGISKEQMDFLLNNSLHAVRSVFFTFLRRWRATEAMLRQSEKMAQFGTLTAGVVHELNNPASAIKRATIQMDEALQDYRKASHAVEKLQLTIEQQATLDSLEGRIIRSIQTPIQLSGLDRSDREDQLEQWLDDHEIDESWYCCNALVEIDCTTTELENLNTVFTSTELAGIVNWIKASYDMHSLVHEIEEGSSRISEIAEGLKAYSYLDQAPVKTIDIREGINSTLAILNNKLGEDITVNKTYAPDLPNIEAYGSELNQVWTNIIDNAIDALEGKGIIEIRARREGENWIIVDIEDNGSGIPEDIQDKVFDTFFTTKEPGKGTGLGLDVSYKIILKHKGNIRLQSKPGSTCFEIWLPISFETI